MRGIALAIGGPAVRFVGRQFDFHANFMQKNAEVSWAANCNQIQQDRTRCPNAGVAPWLPDKN
jgi:hypothetical protein